MANYDPDLEPILKDINERLKAVEDRPQADLAPLLARLDALEAAPAATPPAATPAPAVAPPAPATAAIIARGIPVRERTLPGERMTPTSAAMILHFVDEFV